LKQLFSLQKISVSLCFVILSVVVIAGDPYRPATGARQAGMAYVCVMNSGLWSTFHNQAGLANNKSLSFGFNYENRFNIKELGTRSAGINVPAGKASIGAIYSCFGYSEFKRQMAGLGCGLPLSDKIAAGIQIDYFSERTTGEYNNNQLLTCEAGVLISPSENVKVGMHVFNPVPNSLRRTEMPTRLIVGSGVNLSKVLFAGIEAEMSTSKKLLVRTGFEYEAAEKLWLRGGFSTENSSFSFGLGYKIKPVTIDIGFSSHERLGITSSISLIFNIKNF
jgi:hypothetical protein